MLTIALFAVAALGALWLWFLPSHAAVFATARRLGARQAALAFVPPLGPTITLARCAGLGVVDALMISDRRAWVWICEDTGQPRALGSIAGALWWAGPVGAAFQWRIARGIAPRASLQGLPRAA